MAKEGLEKVILIEPQNGFYTGFQGLVLTEPYGLECVAGAVSDLVPDIQIHDDRIKPGGWRERFKKPPDMVGIRCNYTADVPSVTQLIKGIRAEIGRRVPIVIGGHHISLRPSDLFLPEVDAIAIGPGEKTFRQLVLEWAKKKSLKDVANIWYQDKEGNFVSNAAQNGISPRFAFNSTLMNERPKPRRDLVDQYRKDYYFLYYPEPYTVETARGCRFRCSFCSVWNFHKGGYDVESPQRTAEEIAGLGEGAKYVNIVDDLAFSDINGAKRLAEELIRGGINKRYWAQIRTDNVWPKDEEKRAKHLAAFEKLAEAGLDMVLMGIESFDPDELKRVNKGNTVEQNIAAIKFLKGIGVRIWGAQIVFPNWGVEDFDRTIKINKELGIEAPQFTILTPLPGSVDYTRALKEGTLTTTDPAQFDFFHWTVPTKLPPDELYRQISRLYRETGSTISTRDQLKIDIEAGRTNWEAVRVFRGRFKDLQNEQTHLNHLAQLK